VVAVFTVGEEGLGGLRGARHACRELAPEAVLTLEGHGSDRVFVDAASSLRVPSTLTGPGGHSIDGGTGINVIASRAAGSVPLSHPLVAAVLRARCSIRLPATAADGSTDANGALAAGIPAVALGYCDGENMHGPTDRIRADSFVTRARHLRAALQEILELPPRAARGLI
jgi:acetylornithine deacetylase/succinyl-diaminopimelate desuccinylase-like protein